MTKEQAIAYVHAQAVCAQIELASCLAAQQGARTQRRAVGL